MQAKEVLSHIYQAILKTPEFVLQNGMKCRVDSFFEPEVDSDGDLKCGFDVLTEDGGHLEFTVGRTGWGKSFAKTEAVSGHQNQPPRGASKPATDEEMRIRQVGFRGTLSYPEPHHVKSPQSGHDRHHFVPASQGLVPASNCTRAGN